MALTSCRIREQIYFGDVAKAATAARQVCCRPSRSTFTVSTVPMLYNKVTRSYHPLWTMAVPSECHRNPMPLAMTSLSAGHKLATAHDLQLCLEKIGIAVPHLPRIRSVTLH